jgi:hypothetical protein
MSPPRTVLLAALAVVAITLAAVVAFRLFLERAPEPLPAIVEARADTGGAAPAHGEVAKEEARVVAIEGQVERARRGGPWQPVTAGQTLSADESLRTGAEARADLVIGAESAKMTVADSSQLSVRELTRAVHRLRLTRGRLAVSYERSGERVLRIEDESGSAVAETRGATFSVLSNGQALAVATQTGTVNLKAAEVEVAVGAGQRSTALAGHAPSAAEPIPAQVLLKLAAFGRQGQCAEIAGVASHGAEVTVDGERVPLSSDGRFRRAVANRPGLDAVRVVTREVDGRTREEQVKCRLARSAPPAEVDELKIHFKGADGG